jgi:hypothetical protein
MKSIINWKQCKKSYIIYDIYAKRLMRKCGRKIYHSYNLIIYTKELVHRADAEIVESIVISFHILYACFYANILTQILRYI